MGVYHSGSISNCLVSGPHAHLHRTTTQQKTKETLTTPRTTYQSKQFNTFATTTLPKHSIRQWNILFPHAWTPLRQHPTYSHKFSFAVTFNNQHQNNIIFLKGNFQNNTNILPSGRLSTLPLSALRQHREPWVVSLVDVDVWHSTQQDTALTLESLEIIGDECAQPHQFHRTQAQNTSTRLPFLFTKHPTKHLHHSLKDPSFGLVTKVRQLHNNPTKSGVLRKIKKENTLLKQPLLFSQSIYLPYYVGPLSRNTSQSHSWQEYADVVWSTAEVTWGTIVAICIFDAWVAFIFMIYVPYQIHITHWSIFIIVLIVYAGLASYYTFWNIIRTNTEHQHRGPGPTHIKFSIYKIGHLGTEGKRRQTLELE